MKLLIQVLMLDLLLILIYMVRPTTLISEPSVLLVVGSLWGFVGVRGYLNAYNQTWAKFGPSWKWYGREITGVEKYDERCSLLQQRAIFSLVTIFGAAVGLVLSHYGNIEMIEGFFAATLISSIISVIEIPFLSNKTQ